MHNGSFSSLQDVIEFYNRGGVQNELLSPLIQPLGLTDDEQTALVAFLNSLTGENVRKLVSDAFAVPIGNPGTLEVSQ
jgi:cytochrome c peroxidase